MKDECKQAATWWSSQMNSTNLTPIQVVAFQKNLAELLEEKYRSHWYEEEPERGHAYRSILLDHGRIDAVLLEAGARAKIMDIRSRWSSITEVIMWCNPGSVEICYLSGGAGSKVITLFSKPIGVSPNKNSGSSSLASSTNSVLVSSSISPSSSPSPSLSTSPTSSSTLAAASNKEQQQQASNNSNSNSSTSAPATSATSGLLASAAPYSPSSKAYSFKPLHAANPFPTAANPYAAPSTPFTGMDDYHHHQQQQQQQQQRPYQFINNNSNLMGRQQNLTFVNNNLVGGGVVDLNNQQQQQQMTHHRQTFDYSTVRILNKQQL